MEGEEERERRGEGGEGRRESGGCAPNENPVYATGLDQAVISELGISVARIYSVRIYLNKLGFESSQHDRTTYVGLAYIPKRRYTTLSAKSMSSLLD